MKRTIRIAALLLVLTMTVFMFAACAKKLSGKYVDVTGNVTLEFSGSKYTKTTDKIIGEDEVVKGKYEIDEEAGKITFTPEDGESTTHVFSEIEKDGKEYIVIDILTFEKK